MQLRWKYKSTIDQKIKLFQIKELLLLPISFIHYQKIKKQHENDKIQDDDDLEDVL